MKSMVTKTALMIAGVALMGSMQTASAAEASVGVDVASAYVFRGGTLNDSFVAQPYAELGGFPVAPGLAIGVWANFDLDDNSSKSVEGGHFSEIDLYAAYSLPLDIEGVDLSVGYTEYTYPRAGGSVAADGTTVVPVDADREVNLVASFEAPLSPSIGVYYGVDGGIDSSLYVEGSLGHEIEISEGVAGSLGATVGYVSPDVGEDGFSHATLSAGVSMGNISASVNYVIETDDTVLLVDEEVYGMIGFGFDY